MKKTVMILAAGMLFFTLSSCGKTENTEEMQTDTESSIAEIIEEDGDAQETVNDDGAANVDTDLPESSQENDIYEGEYSDYDVNEPSLEIKKNSYGTYLIQIDLFRLWGFHDGAGKMTEKGLEFTATGPGEKKVNGMIKLSGDIATVTISGQEWLDFAGLSEYRFYKTSDVPKLSVWDDLMGEYEYASDYGAGKLTIRETSAGYDISDYESESSYRFLADFSNIERMEWYDRIYLKYPEQVLSDGTAVFGYYILEYLNYDEINVYYGKSGYEEAALLYHAVRSREKNGEADENTDTERTAEELLDLFAGGQISAVSSEDSAQTFYITDLDMDSDEWDSYSIGERADLDNDGENELILCGPYGGIYLDARDGKVYEFAAGEGTGYMLSYTVYNGATWIMYSNRMHAEYELYHIEKFEGADNLAAEMDFSREPVDGSNIESGMKYTLNGTEISSDEFAALAGKICAAEVYTE